MSIVKRSKIILGIDFGTTGSSFAIKRIEEENLFRKTDLFGVTPEYEYLLLDSQKIPTLLLVNENDEIITWGEKSIIEYDRLYKIHRKKNRKSKNPSRFNYIILKDFKMALRGRDIIEEEEEESGEIELDFEDDDDDEEEIEPVGYCLHNLQYIPFEKPKIVELIGKFLEQLKQLIIQKMEEVLNEVESTTFNWSEDVKLVVSIPTTFRDEEREFYKTAFLSSGLLMKNQKLFFVQEPLAAGFAMIGYQSNDGYRMKKDDVVLILDCGGGTVDITSHLCKDPQTWTFQQLLCDEGKNSGSEFITQSFRNWFIRRYNLVGTKIEKEGLSSEFFFLENQFNKEIKEYFNGSEEEEYIIQIKTSNKTGLIASYLIDLKKNGDKQYPNITISNINSVRPSVILTLKRRIIKSFFDETVGNICQTLEKQVKQLGRKGLRMNRMFCVGGYCKSPYLMKRVNELVNQRSWDIYKENNFKLDSEQYSGSGGIKEAVLKGTVLMGLVPQIISTKRALKTYGIEVREVFDPKKHDERKKQSKSVNIAKDIFNVIVLKDQEIPEDMKVDRCFTKGVNQKVVNFKILASTKRPDGVLYSNDPSVSEIVKFSVNLDIDQFRNTKKFFLRIEILNGEFFVFRIVDYPSNPEFCKIQCEYSRF